jgi:hypothetical protein
LGHTLRLFLCQRTRGLFGAKTRSFFFSFTPRLFFSTKAGGFFLFSAQTRSLSLPLRFFFGAKTRFLCGALVGFFLNARSLFFGSQARGFRFGLALSFGLLFGLSFGSRFCFGALTRFGCDTLTLLLSALTLFFSAMSRGVGFKALAFFFNATLFICLGLLARFLFSTKTRGLCLDARGFFGLGAFQFFLGLTKFIFGSQARSLRFSFTARFRCDALTFLFRRDALAFFFRPLLRFLSDLARFFFGLLARSLFRFGLTTRFGFERALLLCG